MAVVVLPTPPFWLAIAKVRPLGKGVASLTALEPFDSHDPPAGVAAALDQLRLEHPASTCGRQFGLHAAPLQEQPGSTPSEEVRGVFEEAWERGAGSRRDDLKPVGRANGFGSRMMDLHRQGEGGGHMLQESHALGDALDQMDRRAFTPLEEYGQDQPWKTRAGADIRPA